MNDDLGRLEPVELRQVWPKEDTNFTPWLAKEENLKVLSDTLGIDLELEGQEQSIGSFRADLYCKDSSNGSSVLVENQLERTDHSHLGQLLTYAAGLHAATIVWIAAKFTEEHRAALDWLNEVTGESFRFFGLEVELWRIANSPAAPKFNIVSKPNNWSKAVSTSKKHLSAEALSPTKQMQREYWTAFGEVLASHDKTVRPVAPQATSWISHGLGKAGIFLFAAMSTKEHSVRGEIYLTGQNAKALYDLLEQDRQEIERSYGGTLDWRRLDEKQDCRIFVALENADPNDHDDWARQHQWLAKTLTSLHKAFHPKVRLLDLSSEMTDGLAQ